MSSKVRVRFAPSPTGIQHIGGIRTALYNYLFAKKNNGEFLLRIEDTDQKRLVKEAEEALFEMLKWLEIEPEGEVVHQSGRLDVYKKYAEDLVSKKIAYEKEGAIYVHIPQEKNFEWVDLVGDKVIKFKGDTQEDFVILKSDGFPTYHFANVIDDHEFEISHVFRGEEWISSTPKHLYLYESLGWSAPNFVHLPVILGSDHTKLSKRHGAKSVLDYRSEGYLKEAVLNYMALLGWNPGGDREVMTISEMIDLFKIGDINTASPIFDPVKFEWLNGVWIRNLETKELKKRLKDFYKDDREVQEVLSGPKDEQLVKAASTRMKTLSDFKILVSEQNSRPKTKEEEEIAVKLKSHLIQTLGEDWNDEELLSKMKEFSKKENVPFKTIFFLLTGKEQGIGILELNQIYGKEFFIKNLEGK